MWVSKHNKNYNVQDICIILGMYCDWKISQQIVDLIILPCRDMLSVCGNAILIAVKCAPKSSAFMNILSDT